MNGKKAEILEMQVEGMTCGHCEKTVKTALEGVVGAGKARVSLSEGKAWVEGPADPAALISAVAEEGYRARQVAPAGESRP